MDTVFNYSGPAVKDINKAVRVIADSPTLTEAAKRLGVSRATLYNSGAPYLHKKPKKYQLIIEMLENGYSNKAIINDLGVSNSYLHAIRVKYKLKSRRNDMENEKAQEQLDLTANTEENLTIPKDSPPSDITIKKSQDLSTPTTDFQVAFLQAKRFMKSSSFRSDSFKSDTDLALAITKGGAMGMNPYSCLTNIAVINGKVTLHSGALQGVIMGNKGSGYLSQKTELVSSTGDTNDKQSLKVVCTVRRKINGEITETTREFSYQDAEDALLLSRDTWKKYLKRMLTSRAVGYAYRDAFPDILMGVYDPDEAMDLSSNTPVVKEHTEINIVDADGDEETIDTTADEVNDEDDQS